MLVPTLDHVVVNVGSAMSEAEALWKRLGFTLTPRGHHTLGSFNHLAMFGTDYLELIGAPETRPDLLGWPLGLNGIVWASEDADATYAALTEAGIPSRAPQAFSRPVNLSSGARDASFRTVSLPRETTDAGRLYFCQHLTRDLVWRDEWRAHPNGALGVSNFVIAAADPARLGDLFRRMFGGHSVQPVEGGVRLLMGLSNADIVVHAELERRFGAAAPLPGYRAEMMAALVLRTSSAEMAGRIIPAPEAGGVTLAFQT